MTKPTLPTVWASDPGAVITTPPSGLQGLGWAAGEQPAAAHVNWKLNQTDEWNTYIDAYFGGIDGDLFAVRVLPWGTFAQDGLYVAGAGSYGAELRAFSTRGVRLLTASGSVVLNSAGAITGLRSGISGSIRYGYAATLPTYRWDLSPFAGAYTVDNSATDVLIMQTAPSVEAQLNRVSGSGDVGARRALLFPHDTARSTETIYEAVSLTATMKVASATSASVIVWEVDRTTFAQTAILTVTTSSATFATVSDTPASPIVLNPGSKLYYVQIVCVAATSSHYAAFQTVTLNVRKTAVE